MFLFPLRSSYIHILMTTGISYCLKLSVKYLLGFTKTRKPFLSGKSNRPIKLHDPLLYKLLNNIMFSCRIEERDLYGIGKKPWKDSIEMKELQSTRAISCPTLKYFGVHVEIKIF